MKICMAQTNSLKGELLKNIQNHLKLIEHAIGLNADLIVFPELSITAYEPSLAGELAMSIDNDVFNVFQNMSNNNDIIICIGLPTQGIDGICISILIIQPNKERTVYSKQMLHSDELPYFVSGKEQMFLTINKKKLAIGICYETLQRQHFVNAKQHGIDVYLASVAKSGKGIEKAYEHYSKIALEFNTPILMCNSVGYCDNFLSVGQSASWNKKGVLINQLDDENEGLLIYDTEFETSEAKSIKN